MTGWKQYFNKDIKIKLDESKKEFDMFDQTGSIIYLQQAGNKLFSAVENHLMVKYDKQVKSYGQLRTLVRDNTYDYALLLESAQLHYFFYNGEMHMDIEEAKYFYNKVYKKMMRRIR